MSPSMKMVVGYAKGKPQRILRCYVIIALSLLRQEKTAKVGLKTKRFKAALEIGYLHKV